MKVTTHFSSSDVAQEYTAIIIGGKHDGVEKPIPSKTLPKIQIDNYIYHNTHSKDSKDRYVFVP